MEKELSVCVVGLGYVGLPLAYHMSHAAVGNVYGYDIDRDRIAGLRLGVDHTDMVPHNVITAHYKQITWTTELPRACDIYIICVPTPDNHGIPDYSYVDAATIAVMQVSGPDTAIVLESTVAPGTVRSRLIPMLSQRYGFDQTRNLFAFSPERVNPGPTAFGDMVRCAKVVAYDPTYLGDRLSVIQGVYGKVFDVVTCFADTRVAELAKCFENMQRDVNIAMMNELSMICHREGIDLLDVFAALRTKPSSPVFYPGLVGGHCIPVDPYYLAAYYDDVMPDRIQLPIVGRKINEEYIDYIALLAHKECPEDRAVLVCGYTYKPDVNDIRNSGALKIAEKLRAMGRKVVVYDTLMPFDTTQDLTNLYGVVIGAVNHKRTPVDWRTLGLTIDCKFINIGGAFAIGDLSSFGFQNIINM